VFVDDNAPNNNFNQYYQFNDDSYSQGFYSDNDTNNVPNVQNFNSHHSSPLNVNQDTNFVSKNSADSTNELETSHDINLDDLDLWLLKNDAAGFIDNILSQTNLTELKDPQEIFKEISLECEQISKTPSSTPSLVSNEFSFDIRHAEPVNGPKPMVKETKRRRKGPPNELRKVKKRGQNRRAALKYRVKKKAVMEVLESEYDQLMRQNISLKAKIATIQEQVEYFKI